MAELTREVRSAFYRALAGQARLRIADEQMRLADSLVRLAHRREEAGDISALEVQQAAQEAARTRLSASVAREEARVAQAALVRATGGRGAGDLVPVGELDAGLDDPALLPAGGLRTLPVMLAARADSVAAVARLRSAQWTQLPMPSIAAGTEWDDPTATNSNGLMTFGVSLPFPIWQHGGGAVAEARASAGVSAARMRETEMEAERELTTRWERLAERTTRARFARDSLVAGARALREGAFRLYAAGSASILEVFDGFRAERDAEVALIETLVAWQDAAADLDALMGRSE
jgi:cobalt-zinc-cadmium efflux system outer membrane protein